VLIFVVDHPPQGMKDLGRLAQREKDKLFITALSLMITEGSMSRQNLFYRPR
jgi:hypothetical protein